ncbi:PQQ-dependent sugar dehydrogenase, partial [Azoarcus taiwanensis]
MSSTTGVGVRVLAVVVSVVLAGVASAQQRVASEAGALSVVTVAEGLQTPWGLAFLPDGRMLVTERPGRMRIVTADGLVSAPVEGLPNVHASGQGGLLDVV